MEEILPSVYHWVVEDEEGTAMGAYAFFAGPDHGTKGGLLVDPAWDEQAVSLLVRRGPPTLILVTTKNHERDARRYRARFAVPIAASEVTARDMDSTDRVVRPGEVLPADLEVVSLPGVYAGELALYRGGDQSLLYVADALVTNEAGLPGFLPDRLVRDPEGLRREVKALLERPFTALLPAHGPPILRDAQDRLRAILS
jgi:glyoxylase-like metal-dependent hydrolase (beta-lactamase superfamily II)